MDTFNAQEIATKLKDDAESLYLVMEHLEDESKLVNDTQEYAAILGRCLASRMGMFVSTMALIRDSINMQAEKLLAYEKVGDPE